MTTKQTQDNILFDVVLQPAIKIFYLLYKTKNFSKTAQILNISQPTISRNISSLENALGTSLVDREIRPIRFTREGRAFYQLLEQELYNFKDSLLSLAKNSNQRIALRFGCVGSLAAHTNAPILKALFTEVSQIVVYHGASETLKKKFDNDEIDIFISSRPYFEEKTFTVVFFTANLLFWSFLKV